MDPLTTLRTVYTFNTQLETGFIINFLPYQGYDEKTSGWLEIKGFKLVKLQVGYRSLCYAMLMV